MNKRLKEIRLAFNLSQEEFGKRIGIESRAHISSLENGTRNITDRIIKDVCREYCVNEYWLRTGEGEKEILNSKEERFALNLAKLQRCDDETIIRWANAIAETNPEFLNQVESFMKLILGIDDNNE